MALEMSEMVRDLTLEGILRRTPDIDGPELALALIERLHGPALAAKVAASGVMVGGH